jgi:hypothetical protein
VKLMRKDAFDMMTETFLLWFVWGVAPVLFRPKPLHAVARMTVPLSGHRRQRDLDDLTSSLFLSRLLVTCITFQKRREFFFWLAAHRKGDEGILMRLISA